MDTVAFGLKNLLRTPLEKSYSFFIMVLCIAVVYVGWRVYIELAGQV